jgi:hypothetical protein
MLGLYKTWTQQMEKSEHLIAYGPLVRRMNAVFKSRESGVLANDLISRYGAEARKYLNNYINEVASPRADAVKSDLDRFVRAMRGKTAAAYLSWNLPSVLKQIITSPAPFFAYVHPATYAKTELEFVTNYSRLSDAVKEKSVFMKNRKFSPLADLIAEETGKARGTLGKAGAAAAKFTEVGMMGLEQADWVSVAAGWLAVYRQEKTKVAAEQQRMADGEYENLLKQYEDVGYEMYTKADLRAMADDKKLNEAEVDAEAVKRADDIVRLTQPSNLQEDLAPLFKNRGKGGELAQIVLQFQSAMNVIYQNIRYDLPLMVRDRQFREAAGMVAGYVLAGVAVGLLTEGTGDDDDDAADRARRVVFYSFNQFTDAVPVIGSQVTAVSEAVITGKAPFFFSDDLFPMASLAAKGTADLAVAANALAEEDREKWEKLWKRSLSEYAQAAAFASGAPVSGGKQAGRVLGIGDGEEGLDFNPWAIVGRKEKK